MALPDLVMEHKVCLGFSLLNWSVSVLKLTKILTLFTGEAIALSAMAHVIEKGENKLTNEIFIPGGEHILYKAPHRN